MANYNQKIKRLLKNRSGKFTQVPNEIFEVDLSPKAKLIWIYLVSLPKDRDICRSYIGKKFGISKGSMAKLMKELTEKNLVDEVRKGERSDYTVHEIPDSMLSKNCEDQFSVAAKAKTESARTKKRPSKGQKKDPYKYEHSILNTTERKRSGKCSKASSFKEQISPPEKSRTTPKTDSPELRLVTTSAWYQWLINKHALIQFHFPTLSYEERLMWATNYGVGSDKEKFLEEYIQKYGLLSGDVPETLDI